MHSHSTPRVELPAQLQAQNHPSAPRGTPQPDTPNILRQGAEPQENVRGLPSAFPGEAEALPAMLPAGMDVQTLTCEHGQEWPWPLWDCLVSLAVAGLPGSQRVSPVHAAHRTAVPTPRRAEPAPSPSPCVGRRTEPPLQSPPHDMGAPQHSGLSLLSAWPAFIHRTAFSSLRSGLEPQPGPPRPPAMRQVTSLNRALGARSAALRDRAGLYSRPPITRPLSLSPWPQPAATGCHGLWEHGCGINLANGLCLQGQPLYFYHGGLQKNTPPGTRVYPADFLTAERSC